MDTIFLQKPTERLHLQAGQLICKDGDEIQEVYPLASTEQVLVYGNSQITTQALKECLKEGIRVLYFTSYGKYLGRLEPDYPKNINRRINQYKLTVDQERCLKWSRSLLYSKLQGCLIELRRLSEQGYTLPCKQLRCELKRNQKRLLSAGDLEELRGIEGHSAKLYFSIFPAVLPAWCNWTGRNYHPPKDTVNLLLSLIYGCCASELRKICELHSLDTHCGYLHRPCYGGGGLPYDLLESVRATLCDHFVLTFINKEAERIQEKVLHEGALPELHDTLREKACTQFRLSLHITHGKQQQTPLHLLRTLVEETVRGLNDESYIPDYGQIHPLR